MRYLPGFLRLVIVPVAIGLIFVLLYLTFASVKQAVLVLGNIPLALVGGLAALWIRGMNLNLSACSIDQLRLAGTPVRYAVQDGARRRLRPVLITAFVASFGFIPMALATSTGAEVQRPLATVVIGGLFSSTAT